MYVIGVIGGMGSGKSTLCALLAARGATVLSADDVAAEIRRRPAVAAALAARFGDDIIGSDGMVDRHALARRAFTDAASTADLDRICLPPIIEEMASRIRAAADECGLLVVEIPLFDRDDEIAPLLDETICLDASRAHRLQRLVERGFDAEDAQSRMERQDAERFRRQADTVMNNDGGPDELAKTVDRWLDERGIRCS